MYGFPPCKRVPVPKSLFFFSYFSVECLCFVLGLTLLCELCSVVDIATGYWLDGPGIESL